MRRLRAGETEDVCSRLGEGVTDSSGRIDAAGDSSGMADGVGVGDSCAKRTEATNSVRIAVLALFVMSDGVEAKANSQRFLDFARNNKWPRCSSASSPSERGYRATRTVAKILRPCCS